MNFDFKSVFGIILPINYLCCRCLSFSIATISMVFPLGSMAGDNDALRYTYISNEGDSWSDSRRWDKGVVPDFDDSVKDNVYVAESVNAVVNSLADCEFINKCNAVSLGKTDSVITFNLNDDAHILPRINGKGKS